MHDPHRLAPHDCPALYSTCDLCALFSETRVGVRCLQGFVRHAKKTLKKKSVAM